MARACPCPATPVSWPAYQGLLYAAVPVWLTILYLNRLYTASWMSAANASCEALQNRGGNRHDPDRRVPLSAPGVLAADAGRGLSGGARPALRRPRPDALDRRLAGPARRPPSRCSSSAAARSPRCCLACIMERHPEARVDSFRAARRRRANRLLEQRAYYGSSSCGPRTRASAIARRNGGLRRAAWSTRWSQPSGSPDGRVRWTTTWGCPPTGSSTCR